MTDAIRCSRCDDDLPMEAFAPSQRTNGSWCKSCQREYQRSRAHRRPLKPCKDCGQSYDRWHNWSHPGAAGVRCHPCYLAYTRRRQTPNRKRPSAAEGSRPQTKEWRNLMERVFAEETNCGICGDHVDQSLKFPDRMSRTIDHITPVSIGGSIWDRANVRLAHFTCNSRAGATTIRDAATQRLALARAATWIAQTMQP